MIRIGAMFQSLFLNKTITLKTYLMQRHKRFNNLLLSSSVQGRGIAKLMVKF